MRANTDLRMYYAQRAREYEQVYAKAERQQDIARLRTLLQEVLSGHDVLEVACGTGYWTEAIAQTARSIVATDVSHEVLELARTKVYPRGCVHFRLADAFALDDVPGSFTAAFAGFWWSHIPRAQLRTFHYGLHRKLGVGRLVLFADNNYVDGSNHRITRQDSDGNTYQRRTLQNGQAYDVLKNFPSEAEVGACIEGMANEVKVVNMIYYWCVRYRIAAT